MLRHIAVLLVVGCAIADHHEGHGKLVGSIENYHHGVHGKVYAVDEHTLMVKDFEYDGEGPDAYFLVGTEGQPGRGGTILPHPFADRFYDYDDEEAPILKGKFEKVDITLTLPDELKVTDLKYFSVWCRAYSVNFGDLTFPENFDLEGAADAESEPEGEAESDDAHHDDDHAHDHDDHAHHNDIHPLVTNAHDPAHRPEDADAESASEPEGEAESEYDHDHAGHKSSGKATVAVTVSSVIMAVFVASLV